MSKIKVKDQHLHTNCEKRYKEENSFWGISRSIFQNRENTVTRWLLKALMNVLMQTNLYEDCYEDLLNDKVGKLVLAK